MHRALTEHVPALLASYQEIGGLNNRDSHNMPSKRAVGQLTKALAVEWAPHGILVNAIAPGYVDTDLNKDLVQDPAFDKWVKGRCPLGRWATADDIGWPVVFLASSAANFITGQVIYVDGGWLATF